MNITKDQRSEFGKILYNYCLRGDGRKLTQKELAEALREQGIKVQESVISALMYSFNPIGYDQDAYNFLYGLFKALDTMHVPISEELAARLLRAVNTDEFHTHITRSQQTDLIAQLYKDGIIRQEYKTRWQHLPFLGRDKNIQEILDIVLHDEIQWLTLVGVAGAGKSELAWQIMMQMRAHGDFFTLDPISLDGVRSADDVNRKITDRLEGIGRQKNIFLILDDCEEIADNTEAMDQIVTFLQNYPKLTILATSRAFLPSEYREVVPLEIADALQLFCFSAQRIDKKFSLAETDFPEVKSLCNGLDRLPLAMLLAGSLVGQLGVKRLYKILLSREIQELKIVPTPLQKRHLTLDELITVSYNLLEKEEQVLFRRLGVFFGKCSIETVDAVCVGDLPKKPSTLLNWLRKLRNHHLITFDGQMVEITHHILRDYAMRQLGKEEARIKKQLVDYYDTLIDNYVLAKFLFKTDQKELQKSIVILETDRENLTAVYIDLLGGMGGVTYIQGLLDKDVSPNIAGSVFSFFNLKKRIEDYRKYEDRHEILLILILREEMDKITEYVNNSFFTEP